MAKLDDSLKAICQQNPAGQYAIIVVGLLSVSQTIQYSLLPIEGLEAIYTGVVSGSDILMLETIKSIESITLDTSASIL